MKRDRFMREVLDTRSSFADWTHEVLRGAHYMDSPAKLLAEWRAAYGEEESRCAPCIQELEDGCAFYLVNDDSVLLFARTDVDTGLPAVTLYHQTRGPLAYERWRSRALWAPRQLPALPAGFWAHFARVLPPSAVLRLSRLPLSKAWMGMWTSSVFFTLWRKCICALRPTTHLKKAGVGETERIFRNVLDHMQWVAFCFKNPLTHASYLIERIYQKLDHEEPFEALRIDHQDVAATSFDDMETKYVYYNDLVNIQIVYCTSRMVQVYVDVDDCILLDARTAGAVFDFLAK
jgi:hypothetical protein